MDRRLVTGVLAVALAALGACQPGTVRIDGHPSVGERSRYRYEIVATITRSIEGGAPTTSRVATTLLADQKVTAVSDAGVQADVTLRRDGAATRTARVLLNRSGAIRSIELVAGLDSADVGLSQLGSLLPPAVTPPTRALAPGARWAIDEEDVRGTGRLMRLGVVDGADVAVVETSLSERIADAVTSGTSRATLTGTLRTYSTAAYDLEDGSTRHSTARSSGTVHARIEPPVGIQARPVLGTITYDIEVQAVRLD